MALTIRRTATNLYCDTLSTWPCRTILRPSQTLDTSATPEQRLRAFVSWGKRGRSGERARGREGKGEGRGGGERERERDVRGDMESGRVGEGERERERERQRLLPVVELLFPRPAERPRAPRRRARPEGLIILYTVRIQRQAWTVAFLWMASAGFRQGFGRPPRTG